MSRRRATLLVSCALGCGPDLLRIQAVEARPDAAAPESAEQAEAHEVEAGASPGDGACAAPPIDAPVPSPSAAALVLRYDFSGSGSTVRDLVGDGDGAILGGASLDCSGSLSLDGLDDFVDMPNGLVSPHESITAMAWITWPSGSTWERVFAFGNTNRGEGNAGSAVTSLSLTTRSFPGEKLFGMYERQGLHGFEQRALQVTDAPTQVALVFDGKARTLSVYQRGELDGSTEVPYALSQIVDVDDWLGRSHWLADAYFMGALHEFRLYGRALSAAEIAETHRRGMDAP